MAEPLKPAKMDNILSSLGITPPIKGYNEPFDPPHVPDLTGIMPSMEGYKQPNTPGIIERKKTGDYLKYSSTVSSDYLRALDRYLKSTGQTKINLGDLTPSELDRMGQNIIEKIAGESNLKPEKWNMVVEYAKLMKEQEMLKQKGLPALGVMASRIVNSPVGKEIASWMDAAKLSADQAMRDLQKYLGIK